MSKNKDSTTTEAVLEYLKKQNRPYSAVDILNNLHNLYGKTAIQKSLDQLVKDGKLREKVYGKQKVYAIDQNALPSINESELKSMETKISELTESLKGKQEKLKSVESQYATLSSSLTIAELDEQIEKYSGEVKQLSEKLDQLKNSENAISPEEKEKIVKTHQKYVGAWKKRKLIANEMINSILENYPSNKTEFCEEIGIERDEDVGVSFPK